MTGSRHKKLIYICAAVLIGVTIAILIGRAAFLDKPSRLIILYTSDIKGQFLPYSPGQQTDLSKPHGGRLGGLPVISAMRRDLERVHGSDRVILLDVGDAFVGTGFTEALVATKSPGYPLLKMMELAGYDAMAVGNTDLELGADRLRKMYSLMRTVNPQTPFHLLCANLIDNRTLVPLEDDLLLYIGGEKDKVRLHVVSTITEATRWMTPRDRLEGFTITNEESSILRLCQTTTDEPQINVVLLHSENWARVASQIASRATTGLWFIIPGNRISPNPAAELLFEQGRVAVLPSVFSGRQGNEIAEIDIAYRIGDHGELLLSRPVSIQIVELAESECGLDTALYTQLLSFDLAESGYETDTVPCDTKLPFRILSTNPVYGLVGPTAMGNLVTDAMIRRTGAQFAFVNALFIRDGLGPGRLSYEDIIRALPFRDRITTVKLTGQEVSQLLEWNLQLGHRMLHLAGLKQQVFWDGRNAGHDLYADGGNVDSSQCYTVAVTDYLAEGGDALFLSGQTLEQVSNRNGLQARAKGTVRSVVWEYLCNETLITADTADRVLYSSRFNDYLDCITKIHNSEDLFELGDLESGFVVAMAALRKCEHDRHVQSEFLRLITIQAARYLLLDARGRDVIDRVIEDLEFVLPGGEKEPLSFGSLQGVLRSVIQKWVGLDPGVVSNQSVGAQVDLAVLHFLWLLQTWRADSEDELLELEEWAERVATRVDSLRLAQLKICLAGSALRRCEVSSFPERQKHLEKVQRFLHESEALDNSIIPHRLAFWGIVSELSGRTADAVSFYRHYLWFEPLDSWRVQERLDRMSRLPATSLIE